MARKTKAQLDAEREAALAEEMARDAEAYPVRLMMAFEEATTKNNYELEVRNGLFTLRDRDTNGYDNTLLLSYAYDSNSQNKLENLEWDLECKATEREEAERRYAVRQSALSKLSKEEKEILGL